MATDSNVKEERGGAKQNQLRYRSSGRATRHSHVGVAASVNHGLRVRALAVFVPGLAGFSVAIGDPPGGGGGGPLVALGSGHGGSAFSSAHWQVSGWRPAR